MNYKIYIACRLKSARLPLKALRSISGKPLLLYLLQSLSQVHPKDSIILCTSSLSSDDSLVDLASSYGYKSFRGDPIDVAGRFLECNKEHQADYIVRVTGDNPFTCPYLITDLLYLAESLTKDYIYSTSLPIGFRSEVIRTAALQNLYDQWANPHLSEYMTFFLNQPQRVNLYEHNYRDHRDQISNLSFTVDTLSDLYRSQLLASFFADKLPDYSDLTPFYLAANAVPSRRTQPSLVYNPEEFSYL